MQTRTSKISSTTLAFVTALFLSVSQLTAAEPMIYEQSGETQDLYLRGAKLTVTGSDNTLRIMSNCNPLIVLGNNNIIEVMAVDTIDIMGEGNQITWSAGISNPEPVVTDKGKNNTVQAGSVEGD